MPRIAVVGLQHQGIILSAGFAELGHQVTGVDEDLKTVDLLRQGKSSLKEPGLEELLRRNINEGRLQFTDVYSAALYDADFVFLSIDVPFDENGLQLDSVYKAAEKINKYKAGYGVLCVTSQLPVGTTEKLTDGWVAYIPEFLRPGQSVDNFMYPDRIVIGCNYNLIADQIADLYKLLDTKILRTNLRTAEMAKHAHNAILATQISFMNEISLLCIKTGASPEDVAEATKLDHRVGLYSYLNPGWNLQGGHLIRDLRVLKDLGKQYNCSTDLIDAVISVDENL